MFRQRTDKIVVWEPSPDLLFTTKSPKDLKKKKSGKISQRLSSARQNKHTFPPNLDAASPFVRSQAVPLRMRCQTEKQSAESGGSLIKLLFLLS